MRNILFILFILLSAKIISFGQNTRILSPTAIVSLMTVSPGAELYSTFGHSAIRIFDPSQNVDRIYNYGTFDFDQPNFYINFCRGKLLYVLDVERYKGFERGNAIDDRSIKEQVLELTPLQKERLFNLLEENALAQNRSYKYDFFYDNCATRIRDIVRNALYGQVQFDSTTVASKLTMRQLLRPYLVNHPWTGFGIDLVLGMPTDRVSGAENYMFLPDHLHDAFGSATLSEGVNLVGQEFNIPKVYIAGKATEQSPITPFISMCLVAVLGVLCMFNAKSNRVFDFIFWFVLGIGGVIIFFLWFLTDHQATKSNLNLFWLLPTHLLVFWRARKEGLWESYFLITAIIAAGLLIGMKWLPQELPIAAIPIMVLIVIKGVWRPKQQKEMA
jgi:hypothetical protein